MKLSKLVAIAMAATIAVGAPAQAVVPVALAQSDQERSQDAWSRRVHAAFVELHQNHATQSEVVARMSRDFGLEQVRPIDEGLLAVSPAASTNADVTVDRPTYFWDNPHHMGFVYASWQWSAAGAARLADEANCMSLLLQCARKAVGGPDGFAVTMNGSYVPSSYYLSVSDRNGVYQGMPALSTSSTTGAGFTGQDQFWGNVNNANYSWYSGVATLSFTGFNGCGKTLQMFSRLAHSWSTTSVNGFSIGVWSIGVNWNNTSYAWSAASQPSSTYPAVGC